MKRLLTLLFAMLIISAAYSQTTYPYKGKNYEVQTGSKNGKFIILDDSSKHYIVQKVDTIKDNGNGTATYKGNIYKIAVGSRGGRYIISASGNKHYLPKL